ncbi:bifunctional glutamate--cysteine ligase GshA/glutathione synthetase GshB [Flammeovirga yaeyamensis]|uniref:Glutamate--cysteine ligase n=1 Tax=Flammeovirga yaeyamensis TaxID=367791 RepID=A0AAX1ND85_9BACT|nr:bifunctional glutamate--cysteine ligase GshA/glutathione synthetase GshB [Flammeovirga yaeyamensis]MBB3699220.1 glutamate--cysteine ligase [Flammeovirga yaeyamensis]NMF35517.1 bifunctional glutamate--cysteine ligase GshA/glutathione synthetase GshB [Flammeovirga yaeyamensis]QWG04376.1 bifunctional glutamate--cysteine ligase GshA/glutathione synthetase GshB [Flammeovirga yaeyamensis]
MHTIQQILKDNRNVRIFEGNFGLEKENVRITKDGKMATTSHPSIFGNKLNHPYITTDFSESQVEMITPPLPSIKEALGFLETIHDVVTENLGDELLWPQSTPPELPENDDDIKVADFGEEGKENEEYRNFLASKYGKKKQLLSGIHYNFSLEEKNIEFLYQQYEGNISYDDFREELYLKLTRNFLRYRWYLIALLGNSPALHNTYLKCCIDKLPKATRDSHHFDHAISMRSSVCGYKNIEDLVLDYSSLKNYESSIDNAIKQGVLNSNKENYTPIRLKEVDGKLKYVEVRLLDLDPQEKIGISEETAKIVHLFLLFCLFKESKEITSEEQKIATENQEIVASEGLSDHAKIIVDGKETLLSESIQTLTAELLDMFITFAPDDYKSAFKTLMDLSENKKVRPSCETLKAIQGKEYIDWHLEKAIEYSGASKGTQFKFHGLEDMELSTQLVLREAILRGIKFDIMDRTENFIKLEKNGKVEHVMQATRTSLDNYVSVLMMENKVMTKKVIENVGIRTPKGDQYTSVDKAKSDFVFYQGQSIVIKPKSTNFGLGISILKDNQDKKLFDRAVEIAFEHDNSILIEEFVTGKEYRIFIINDEVVGILHRVPANVKGDGKSTVRELVIEKNKDPLRGKGYKTPLEKIALGEAEEMFLKTQGYDFDYIPSKDQIVYLRENSNISTGGDSIDYTDDIPDSYKHIAVEAAKALDVKITGLDMMIDDIHEEASEDNYAIIEMNFNPAIHIHCYPYKGKNRRLNAKVLEALGY